MMKVTFDWKCLTPFKRCVPFSLKKMMILAPGNYPAKSFSWLNLFKSTFINLMATLYLNIIIISTATLYFNIYKEATPTNASPPNTYLLAFWIDINTHTLTIKINQYLIGLITSLFQTFFIDEWNVSLIFD